MTTTPHGESSCALTGISSQQSRQPLDALLAIQDRETLASLSHYLSSCGFRVYEAASQMQAVAALETVPPSFVLVDEHIARGEFLARCHESRHHSGAPPRFTLCLIENATADAITDFMVAGVDDFLQLPVVLGEVLTRLRAAARSLEFERRVRYQFEFDASNGFPSRAALEQVVTDWVAQLGGRRRSVAISVMDLDFFSRINRQYGRPVGDEVLLQVSDWLRQHCNHQEYTGSLGAGRYGILHPDLSETEVASWTQQTCNALSCAEFEAGGITHRLTASAGVAAWFEQDGPPTQLLKDAITTLRWAKHSGRDCVLGFSESLPKIDTLSKWQRPAGFLDGAVAWDFMTPCSAVLERTMEGTAAAKKLDQWGLEVVPLVHHGKATNLVIRRESIISNSRKPIEQFATTAKQFSPETTAVDLLTALAEDETSYLLVIDSNDRPVGIVTAEELALLGEPLDFESFRHTGETLAGTDALVVSDYPHSVDVV
jgi:diguanylate cyclase (GGDEF)-like protein